MFVSVSGRGAPLTSLSLSVNEYQILFPCVADEEQPVDVHIFSLEFARIGVYLRALITLDTFCTQFSLVVFMLLNLTWCV